MLIVGEVHTGLLRGRDPVGGPAARALVDLVPGERVLVSQRPRSYVRSPDKPVGVDCPLGAPAPARQVRGIGTALQRAAITGGHVVQGSAYATVERGEHSARQPWSHYLARPGIIETIGRTGWEELARSFAEPRRAAAALDLGGIAGQAVDRVQRTFRSGESPRLRAARTSLRWIAEPKPGGVRFAVHDDELRVLHIGVPEKDPAPDHLAALAEDVALHDWLLTALLTVMDKAAIGTRPREEALQWLLPAIDYLLHLWLPGARGDDLTDRVWAALERRAGFSRQWDSLVLRIRDQLSVGAVAALSTAMRR